MMLHVLYSILCLYFRSTSSTMLKRFMDCIRYSNVLQNMKLRSTNIQYLYVWNTVIDYYFIVLTENPWRFSVTKSFSWNIGACTVYYIAYGYNQHNFGQVSIHEYCAYSIMVTTDDMYIWYVQYIRVYTV